jgi:hypothetical protein
MARKTELVTIDAQNRDHGKTFVVTEMAADAAERWAVRALLALGRAGVELPDGSVASMAAFASHGFAALGKLNPDDLQPLLDEMMACVKYQAEKGPAQRILPGDASQIEEVATRMLLRLKVFELHTGFSVAGAPQTTEQGLPASAQSATS